MGGGGSNKPIVFVFGTKKGDADGRKKNLSAINTQVAYRAHERRREKKNRQRAQAKQDGQVGQPVAPIDPSPSIPTTTRPSDIAFSHCPPQQQSTRSAVLDSPKVLPPQQLRIAPPIFESAYGPQVFIHPQGYKANVQKPPHTRLDSDNVSDSSSEQDTTWSNSPASLARRYSTPGTDISSISPTAPVQINSYFDKALDPFYRLPTVASERERWLVHFYFTEMGHIGFGTHPNSLFCPDRDWVSTYVSSRSMCFQWVLILAEEHLGRLGVLPDQTKTLERKAKAYGDLTTILKSRAVDRDEGISGIMYAAIVDTACTSIHLSALDRYINDSGGFEAFLDGPLGVAHPEHVATVYAFGKCPVANRTDLEAIKAQFLFVLHMLYDKAQIEQEEKRRIRNRRPWDTLSRQILDNNGVLVPATHDEHFRYYIKAQQDCFTSDCIATLLNSTLDLQSDWIAQARHMATLVQTSLISQEFGDNYLARAMYLKRLKYVAEMSTARNPTTGTPFLSHGGLLLINSYVRQEVQSYFDRTKLLIKGVRISKAVVDALKVFGLLSQSTRSLIVSWLRDWLCYNERFEGSNSAQLKESDLDAIGVEITQTWMKEEQKG